MLNNPKMKKMKKLLLNLAVAVVIGGSFTSCIENEVPDEIKSIYAGQADLLAAQAALLESEAAVNAADVLYKAAQAEYQKGLAAYQNALASQQEAQAAKVLAQIEIDVAKAAQDLQEAIGTWQIQMQKLQAELVNTQNTAISAAYNNYIVAKNNLDGLKSTEISRKADIVTKMQALADRNTTNASAYAGLESDLATEQSKLATLNDMLADYEALLAAGSSLGDRLALNADYKAQVEAKTVAINNLAISINQSTQKITQLGSARAATGYDDVMTDYTKLQDYHTALVSGGTYNTVTYKSLKDLRDALPTTKSDIEDADKAIAEYEVILADYTAYVDGLKLAETEAEDAVKAQETIVENAEEALGRDTVDATDGFDGALLAAEAVLGTEAPGATGLYLERDDANQILDAAAQALADKISNKPDLAALQTIIDGQVLIVSAAQTAFNTAQTAFNDNPAGTTVQDAGADGIIGDNGVGNNSYVEVLAVDAAGVATVGTTQYSSLPAGRVEVNGGSGPGRWDNFDDTAVTGDEGKFYNVGLDDANEDTNTNILDAKADALDAAKEDLADAEGNLENAESYSTADEQDDYDRASDVYNNASVLLADAKSDVDDAQADVDAEEKKITDAEALLGSKVAPVTKLYLAEDEAQTAVSTVSTKTEIEDALQLEQAKLAALNITLADDTETLEEQIAESDRVLEVIETEPVFTAEQIAANEAVEAEEAVKASLEAQDLVLDNEILILNAGINALTLTSGEDGLLAMIGIDANGDEVLAANGDLTGILFDINEAEEAVETAQGNVDAYDITNGIAGLEAALASSELWLANTQSQISAQEPIVLSLKVILDSLL
jgi:hypothetical protein